MKKSKKLILLMALPCTLLILFISLSFRSGSERVVKPNSTAAKFSKTKLCAGCSSSTAGTDLYNGCPSACTSVWIVNNITWSKTGSTVNFNNLYYCFWNTGTPPWTSLTYLGTLGVALRPAGTRTFTTTDTGGNPVQCTIYSSGDWYIKHTGSTLPSGSSCAIAGSYSL